MLQKIIYLSIKNKLVVLAFTLVLIIWGLWSATRLSIDAVPDITNNQAQIITLSPTLAAQEVEQFVTYPIEQSLANLPDLTEMRSISRFGLSVITVVFEEKVDPYFARQLLLERLKEAEEKIPPGMGKPELAPLSSGLGEIYQYILHPVKGAESKYSAMDLRILQDWVIARQLYGTPGVAEVNSFGGLLKQYEVALDPNRLKAMNVSINEVFTALEKNNQNTGGGYIDKQPNAYFIRSMGMMNNLEDIQNTAIKTDASGVPLYIKDVAKVQIGHALRYGALSYNGEKEAVGGIVMMLKGANSAEVVSNVKEKLEVIRKSLPADVEIEAFIDRTDLVKRAIKTVETNLIEGALIVIFVLVLFLGNLRAGLIVASAIPLSLLFALGMMQWFGVSANLMSLGAIDFGLIVDGALIVVEATMHHLGLRRRAQPFSQEEMDKEVFLSASSIRKSASFGELIILIVYIPILALTGIEGKMFKPMAQTVSFAILGALILSLTYIPVMCSLFLSRKASSGKTFSDRMMHFFHRMYQPLLLRTLRAKSLVIGLSIVLLSGSLLVFSRLGGEFIPQLQEGDFAFHCILPQGSSLSQSMETSMLAQRIIKSFPEVKTVVSKTGSAEIPTDPMPPEASDLIITLKPRKEWKSAKSYEALAAEMIEKLEVIPGVFFEATQPIQMRFNELMTGVRQDVAIKIFGENIDTLAVLGQRITGLIQTIPGISTPQIERTTGLPQITVSYNRTRLANYQLTIEEVNQSIRTAFAGEAASVIYEDERKFDLVVRLDSTYRRSIEDVSDLYIAAPGGIQVPLSQLAEISLKEGPAQISREDGKRRLVIGFNIQGRDVQSVVREIQAKLDQPENALPTGYSLSYGGTFKNFEEAAARLKIAVPLALLLIFIMLYFNFNSIRQALLIYVAIPLSAIGGIIALWLRDMPFSISAGVGFIALFGVAVLNGIVLLSTFQQLARQGVSNPARRVISGTKMRLRAVLMTASVASLGFLPMALSTSAGAEVQKPLATVVIGGLVSATLLTLLVIPCLYLLNTRSFFNFRKAKVPLMIVLLLGIFSFSSLAQQRISPEAAVDTALLHHRQIALNQLQVKKAQYALKGGREIPKTGFFVENEDIRPSDSKGILKMGVSQSIAWPGFYQAQKAYLKSQLKRAELLGNSYEVDLRKEVLQTMYQLWYLQAQHSMYQQLDSLYLQLEKTAALRFKTGEAAGLEKMAASVKSREINNLLLQNKQEMQLLQQQLMLLLNQETWFLPPDAPLPKLMATNKPGKTLSPFLAVQQQQIELAEANLKIQQNAAMPEFSGRFFSQRLYGVADPFTGFSVSVALPLWPSGTYKNKIREAKVEKEVQEQQWLWEQQQWVTATRNMQSQVEMNRQKLLFYEESGNKQADELIRTSLLGYRSGALSFADLQQFYTQAIGMKQNYLEALNQYNQSIIQLNYYQYTTD